MRWLAAVLAVLLVGSLSALAPHASAQITPTGNITGTTFDEFGNGLSGVRVEVFDDQVPLGGQTPVASGTTGVGGSYLLTLVPTDTWLVRFTFADGSFKCFDGLGGSSAACFPPNIVPVNVIGDGGVTTTGINAVRNPACTPGSANNGLTNMGFESGFAGWTQGVVTDSVATTGADAFTSPFEGSSMARLGTPAANSDVTQTPGPNVICQDFVVTEPLESFAFNIFTYDYTGFDQFRFQLTVTNPATGAVLGSFEQGAWGTSGNTTLKSSGWQGATLNLAGRLGQTVRLTFSAGGTSDPLYPFWVYLDSAEDGAPTPPVGPPTITSSSGSDVGSSVFPIIAQPSFDPSPLSAAVTVTCPSGGSPTAATLLVAGLSFPMLQAPDGSGQFSVTTIGGLSSGPIVVQANCPDPDGTLVQQVGEYVLYDPSGYLTDLFTGEPIEGAAVTLYEVPGWSGATTPGAPGTDECETNESKPVGAPWSQPAPTALSVEAAPFSGKIDPQVNPFVSNPDGYYGWDVAAGCWYVVVEADGYETLTSPVVGVPSEVTDLDLALTPDPLPSFPDVPVTHPFWFEITWMALNDITSGFPDGNLRPAAGVTRQAFAAFGSRYLTDGAALPACATAPFSDVPTSHPFCAEIAWMAAEGLVSGFADGTFRPGNTITRQAFSAIAYRMAGSPDGEDPTCATPPFDDVATSNPFCGETAWMAGTGIATGFPDGSFRPGGTITRQAMSAFLYRLDEWQSELIAF